MVVVTGNIHVSRLTAGPAIDLASGASAVSKGRRFELERWRHDAIGSTIDVSTRDVGSRLFDVPMFAEAQADYALVNRARGEGVILRSQGMNYSGEGMIIPGSTMTTRRVNYTLPLDRHGVRIVDDAWLRDAKLQVIEAEPLGSYKVTLPPLAAPRSVQ